jgi:hypothetical protein
MSNEPSAWRGAGSKHPAPREAADQPGPRYFPAQAGIAFM